MSCKKCKCKVCSCIKNDVPKIAVNGIVQNQNENDVVNIKVPTKTSQLINDSGFGQGNGGGTGGQKIEDIRVNGELVPIINKEAIMNVPTKTSNLINDSNFVTKIYVDTHIVNKANPHNVTKEQIGLGNVDNTSDLNKPISTATQTELDKKIYTTDIKSEVVYEDLKPINSKAVEKYAVKKINTIADLRNTQGEYEGQVIELLGITNAGDFNAIKYTWTDDQQSDNGGTIINAGNGSWLAVEDSIPFLVKETKSDFINMSQSNIDALKKGLYKGVTLLGYYSKGDTPAPIEYYLSDTAEVDDGGSVIAVGGIKLEHKFIDYVTPRNFGYFGEGDAMPYLQKMHEYANKNKIPVIIDGNIQITSSGTIYIDTNADYSRSVLTFDLSIRNTSEPLFEFSSDETKNFSTIDISNTSFKASIIARLKKGCIYIPELETYKDKLLIFEDNTTPDAVRLNSNGTEQSRSFMMDCTVILDGGKLSTPIRTDFNNITRIKYYNTTENITFKPGIVKYSGNNNSSSYLAPTYYIHRSNFNFEDAIIEDANTSSVKNVINQIKMDYSYNVRFKNVKAQAIKDNSGGSTYFLNPYMCCNTILDNVVADNNDNSWGAIGSNYWKDVLIVNSRLNRIDGHFGLYNLRVENSFIGYRGIRAVGGGYLQVINCSARCQDIINFREDYGAKWDGDILIDNINWQLINTTSAQSLVRYTIFDYDFLMYKKFADSITIRNIKIDASFVTAGTALVRAIEWGGFTSYDIQFPINIDIKDVVNISSTLCQFLVFQTYAGNLVKYKVPVYIGGMFTPSTNRYRTNTYINIDNVIGNRELLTINVDYDTVGISNGSIVPKINISNTRLFANIGALKGEVSVINCEVARFIAYQGTGYAQGMIKFTSCIIKPNGSTSTFENHYNVPSAYTKFIGCTIYSPLNGNSSGVSNVNSFYSGIFNINTWVKCTHIGTEMAEDLKTYLSANSNFLYTLSFKTKEDSDSTLKIKINQAPASADTATQATGATPTKAEFDALLAELRDVKTKLRTAGTLAP